MCSFFGSWWRKNPLVQGCFGGGQSVRKCAEMGAGNIMVLSPFMYPIAKPFW
jgi:hypothetical protein